MEHGRFPHRLVKFFTGAFVVYDPATVVERRLFKLRREPLLEEVGYSPGICVDGHRLGDSGTVLARLLRYGKWKGGVVNQSIIRCIVR